MAKVIETGGKAQYKQVKPLSDAGKYFIDFICLQQQQKA
jgi:hypothetical protein